MRKLSFLPVLLPSLQKHFYKVVAVLCCLLFCAEVVFSQEKNASVIQLHQIPAEGVLLDKAWKFHASDNPEYAKPSYDDSRWETINPAQDIHILPQVRNAGVSWFRLTLSVDTSLLNKPIAFVINQAAASEIYLNGKLLKQFGQVSKDPKQLQTFNPKNKPFIIQFLGTTEQVIAVRYAIAPNTPYLNYNGMRNPCFSLQLQQADNAVDDYATPIFFVTVTGYFQFGIFLILSLLHLFFYLFYHQRNVNLYFSIYTFAQALSFLGDFFFAILHNASALFYVDLLFFLSANTANFFLPLSVYKLFHQPFDRLLKFIIAIGILSIPIYFLQYDWGWLTVYINFILGSATSLWISSVAIRKKIPGGKVILIGQALSLFFFLVFTTATVTHTASNLSFFDSILYQIAFTIAFLCPPIFISLILAKEFAETNQLLKHQLHEVEKLSQKTIAQEQEKQQILATQNETLEKQVTQRTAELKQSLEELKSTQAQLIQREKMASLGELTAGIAHEIQNPLNFVNNFSEVSTELIDEMEEALQKEDKTEALTLASDIKENLQKINQHGKRADSIVKGMLEHSRQSTGNKELTNMNALTEEYLRLSYHGMRAKDKTFNAVIETHFDDSIQKATIVPQDIGRVLLNILNNAFYAVNEKKKKLNVTYEPVISVSTKKENDKIEIGIKDNGTGISKKVVDKIFQPFFTTKPTGQGTGLGLSLSYDIIKSHGGAITVESKEGEGTAFIIQIPT